MFSAVPNRFKYRQNARFRDIALKNVSAVPNRFKYRYTALFSDLGFKRFSKVTDCFKLCLYFVFKNVSAVQNIILNSVRMYHCTV